MTAGMKTMDAKLERTRNGVYRPVDFIIADAKDGDMAIGASAPGPLPRQGTDPGLAIRMRPMADYRDGMRQMIQSGLVDIMLSSVSSAEILIRDGTLDGSPGTLAIRLNDASDIWGFRGAGYRDQQARPFRTARVDRARELTDLGLYAITFYNDIDRDINTLAAYSRFRDDASAAGMRHFLEVFNPAFAVETGDVAFGHYLNDAITRCLAGVASRDRPLFLKMPYNGPAAMEELAAFDPGNLIVGILGGAAGTTRDTFELVAQAERYGARVALFGRKIWFAESSVDIVRGMRSVVEGEVSPAEAVRIYHSRLAKLGVAPKRPLSEDIEVTEDVLRLA